MRLTELLKINSQITESSPIQGYSAGGAMPSELLHALMPGQIVRGEMVADEKGDVWIRLMNDLLLEANVDGQIPCELGKSMDFQVRGNGNRLVLTPLQTNLSMEGPVTKALQMAELPVNSITGELTKQMMQAGLPIDRNTLQQVYKEVLNFPAVELSDFVDLHRLGLPVTDENLEQMNSYKNLSHQLQGSLEAVAGQLDILLEELRTEDPVEAGKLMLEVMKLLDEEGEIPWEIRGMTHGGGEENLTEMTKSVTGEAAIRDAVVMDSTAQDFPETVPAKEDRTGQSSFLNSGAQSQTAPVSEEEIIELLHRSIRSGDVDKLRELYSGGDIKKILLQKMDRQWTISPENVAEDGQVEELYGRLGRQLKGIAAVLEQAGRGESSACQAAMNTGNSIDFLHQINQMYAYVQIPMRLMQGKAQGELYVYTRKRDLSQKDGPITALLHLDMEHLGPLDVYISMQNQKVSTSFTVQDEEMLDFLEGHMELLTKRLQDKGYDISLSATVRAGGEEKDRNHSGIHPILAQTGGDMLIQTKGFDVRT